MIFRTAYLSEAMNAYFDAIEDDLLNWRSEVLRAVGTDITALRGSRKVTLWDVVTRYQMCDAV